MFRGRSKRTKDFFGGKLDFSNIFFRALNVIINMLGVFFMKEFKHLGVYGLVLNDEKILLVRKKGGSV